MNFPISKQSSIKREDAILIAKEYGQEAEIEYAMENGCNPEEALIMLDLYPYRQKAILALFRNKSLLSELSQDFFNDLIGCIASDDPTGLCELIYILNTKKTEGFPSYKYNKPSRPKTEEYSDEIIFLEKLKSNLHDVLISLREEMMTKADISERISLFIKFMYNSFGFAIHDPNYGDWSYLESLLFNERNLEAFQHRLELIIDRKISDICELKEFIKRDNELLCCRNYDPHYDLPDYMLLFVERMLEARKEKDPSLKGLYRKEAVKILREHSKEPLEEIIFSFLIGKGEKTIRKFASTFFPSEDSVPDTSINVIVRANGRYDTTYNCWYKQLVDKKGNIGNYLIYIEKDGEEKLLKFPRKQCFVYYLMFLIDHKNRVHDKNRIYIEIDANKIAFKALYQKVYNIDDGEFNETYDSLLCSENKYGKIGVPLREVVYKIKKTIKEAFESFDENPYPYIMTNGRHLTVSPEKIIFEGPLQKRQSERNEESSRNEESAQKLLEDIKFC